jgi:hypothetical protein
VKKSNIKKVGNALRGHSLLIVLIPHSVLVVYRAVKLIDDDGCRKHLLRLDDWLGDHVHVVPVLGVGDGGLWPVAGVNGNGFQVSSLMLETVLNFLKPIR